MKFRHLCLAFCFLLTVVGCSTKMESPDAQVIKLEFKEGSGTASGILKAGTPGMAGLGSHNFDITVPGSVEVKGGPSEYTITFNPLSKELMRAWTLSVDGRVLQRGADMVVEEDKGPRVTFMVTPKAAASATPSP